MYNETGVHTDIMLSDAEVLPTLEGVPQGDGSSSRTGDAYHLDPSEIKAYKEQGYIRLPGLLTSAEIDEIEVIFDQFMAGKIDVPGKDFCDMSQAFGNPFDEWRLVNVMLPREYHPALQGNILERRAQSIARQLLGEDMDLDYDQLLMKRPSRDGDQNGAVFAWHQDLAYWPQATPDFRTVTATPDFRTVTVSLAFNDADTTNGCLRVIPGSHREPELRRHRPLIASRDELRRDRPLIAWRDNAHALTVDLEKGDRVLYLPLRRGDITVHDERIVHGSDGNTCKDRPRKTYVLAFRSQATIAAERAMGFNHSHNTEVNWDTWTSSTSGKKEIEDAK